MRKVIKKFVYFAFVSLISFLIIDNVKAYNYETTDLRLYSLQNNFKICVKSPLLENEHNVYIWSTFDSNRALQAWPGLPMTQDNGQIYCYTHTADDNVSYNFAIFNGNSKQTINLSTINDSKGIINAMLYKFDESGKNNENKYVGAWHVYDTSKIVELVNVATSLNKDDYTIASFNTLESAMGDTVDVGDVTVDNQGNYNLGAYYLSQLNDSNDILDKLVINYSSADNQYTALYVDKYNELATALNNLVKRKDIVVDNSITGGTLAATYNANSDTSITITAQPSTGYKLKSIRVSKITSYDANNQPVLGESTDIDITSQAYTYSFNSDDTMVGMYVTGVFEKIKYKLTFQVGQNGKISTISDGEVLSPVTVEYDDNYNLKITANEGYEVDKVLVDGVEYQLTDGVLVLQNIRKDTNVEISFKIKVLNVKIDGENHTFTYGTSYEDVLKSIDTNKEGYKFKGLKDKNGNVLDNNYVVKEDNELTTIFEEIKKESNNPYTVDSIMKSVILFVVSAVTFTLISYILLTKLKRKNG